MTLASSAGLNRMTRADLLGLRPLRKFRFRHGLAIASVSMMARENRVHANAAALQIRANESSMATAAALEARTPAAPAA